jgi:apolipoprotein D and lipocalin family protein
MSRASQPVGSQPQQKHQRPPSLATGYLITEKLITDHSPSKSMNLLRRIAIVLMGLGLTSCCTTKHPLDPPATAKRVDLSRYVGRWYEIARLPMPFQKAGEAALAEYGSNPDGTLSVHNIAIRPDGSQHDIRGRAKVLNPPANTKLAVRFSTWFGPLIPMPKQGNYWVLHVDDRYQEAIVGTPNRKYLWLLARTPTISTPSYDGLVAKAAALGFDVSRLIKAPLTTDH